MSTASSSEQIKLKIDQYITDQLSNDSVIGNREIQCELSHDMGAKVIAEGIETDRQRDFLAKIGCDYGQGFLYSKALHPEDPKTFVLPDF